MKTAYSARTIALVRQHVREMLTDEAELLRKTIQAGPYGEVTWTVVGTLACRVIRSSQKDDVVIASTMVTRTKYHAIFAPGSDVRIADRVRIGGEDYEVLRIIGDLTDSYGLRVEVGIVAP